MFVAFPEIRGGEVDLGTGAIRIANAEYFVENFRRIPIKMSLDGYRFDLVRRGPGGGGVVAGVLEYREPDRGAPMDISFVSDDARCVVLQDIAGLEFDIGFESGIKAEYVALTPELLCSALASQFDAASQLREEVEGGALLYRTSGMPYGEWKRFPAGDGYLPYIDETARYVREQVAVAEPGAEVIFANEFFNDCEQSAFVSMSNSGCL